MIWFFFTTVKRLDQSWCKINRGGLIFTVLAHSLYLLTQSILQRFRYKHPYPWWCHSYLPSLYSWLHSVPYPWRADWSWAQICMPTRLGWWSHTVCRGSQSWSLRSNCNKPFLWNISSTSFHSHTSLVPRAPCLNGHEAK